MRVVPFLPSVFLAPSFLPSGRHWASRIEPGTDPRQRLAMLVSSEDLERWSPRLFESPTALMRALMPSDRPVHFAEDQRMKPLRPGEDFERWGQYVRALHRLHLPDVETSLRTLFPRWEEERELAPLSSLLLFGAPDPQLPLEARLMAPGLLQWFLRTVRELPARLFQEVSFRIEQGVIEFEGDRSIYYWREVPEPGFSSLADPRRSEEFRHPRGIFVAVHGMFQDRESLLDPFLEPLARDQGLEIWTYDQGGFGLSKGFWSPFEEATLTEPAIRILEKVREEGNGPVLLVGFSMGGVIALRVAQLRPDLVDGLVLLSPPFRPRRRGIITSLAESLSPFAAEMAEGRPSLRPPPLGFSQREILHALKGTSFHTAFSETVDRMADEMVPKGLLFEKPTLIFYNPEDAVVDPAGLEELLSASPHRARITAIHRWTRTGRPNSFHNIYTDPQVREEVVAFIGSKFHR